MTDTQPPYHGLIRVEPRFPDGHWLATLTMGDGRLFEGTDPTEPHFAIERAAERWVIAERSR